MGGLTVKPPPVAWLCEDLVMFGQMSVTRDAEFAQARADDLYEGKPTWRVTPLYAASPSGFNDGVRAAAEAARAQAEAFREEAKTISAEFGEGAMSKRAKAIAHYFDLHATGLAAFLRPATDE